MQIKTVGVLGCGLMGSGIAQVAAASGYKTLVREVNQGVLDKGLGRMKKFLEDGVTKGKVVAVMQPHRYTRLSSLFPEFCSCFNNADAVIVAPVYAAGEAPIEGATHDALLEGLRDRGHRGARKIDTPDELAAIVKELVKPGDIVVCLGAGTITQWAYALPQQLAALDGKAGAA